MSLPTEEGEFAQLQREQLAAVHNRKTNPAEAENAAAELLAHYSHIGELDCAEAQQEIERGMRNVMHKVATAGLSAKGRCFVKPLDFFGDRPTPARQGRRDTASSTKANRLALRMGFNDLLGFDELVALLSTDADKKTLPMYQQPKTPKDAIRWATSRVMHLYGSVTREQAEQFVLWSFSDEEIRAALDALPKGLPPT